MITIEDLILRMMPFSKELISYCKDHPSFTKALKIIYFDRFITLQVVSITYSPNYPNDEVIGFYVYDYGNKTPRFKQDFIVNIGGKNKEFILYTGLGKAIDGKKIKHINEFLEKYGKGGYYVDTHWQTLDQLPDKIKERAKKAMALSEKRKNSGNPEIPQELINKIYKKLEKENIT